MRNKVVKVAYIFPGQGAQYVGMGRSLYSAYPEAKEIFDTANDILEFDIRKLCFEGPLEELSQTRNSQPAIMVHSMAALRVLENSGKRQEPAYVLGLSVGEYIALAASGAVDYPAGLKLLRKRAIFMEEASALNRGKMMAIIGLDLNKVEGICKETGAEVANLNSPGQIVVSCRIDAADDVSRLAREKGAVKAVALNVSGGFHSSLMKPAADKLKKELDAIQIKKPVIPLVCNVSARPESDPQAIRKNLLTQLTTRTLWEESVKFTAKSGISTFIELGPGKVLKGLLRRIDSKLTVHNLDTAEDLSSF